MTIRVLHFTWESANYQPTIGEGAISFSPAGQYETNPLHALSVEVGCVLRISTQKYANSVIIELSSTTALQLAYTTVPTANREDNHESPETREYISKARREEELKLLAQSGNHADGRKYNLC